MHFHSIVGVNVSYLQSQRGLPLIPQHKTGFGYFKAIGSDENCVQLSKAATRYGQVPTIEIKIPVMVCEFRGGLRGPTKIPMGLWEWDVLGCEETIHMLRGETSLSVSSFIHQEVLGFWHT
jgi:hypothetical protein